MDLRFSIAGVTWRVLLPAGLELDPGPALRPFAAAADTPWDHTLEYDPCGRLPEPEGTLIYRSGAMRVYDREGQRMRYEGPAEGSPETARRCIRRSGVYSRVSSIQRPVAGQVSGHEILGAIEAEHQIVRHGGFLLHASWIRWRNRAILFTAPSGTGKSTQAELWRCLRGAELINGDRAAVFPGDDGVPEVRGVPFSGSSGVGRNERMPLGAIVHLSQATRTVITPLTGFRAFRSVWEGCSVNAWDREDVELCAESVTRVLERIPVWHLACTPDECAVQALENELKGW